MASSSSSNGVLGGSVDVVRFEIRRLENAVSKLVESNEALVEALEAEPDDVDFQEAVAENEGVIAKYRSQIAELEALIGVSGHAKDQVWI
ncbi:uncharacterized protein AMSG_00920 [Thecamonas trahens ATCC 50062]|uniref:Uncharacterized protein n=1 Tax=Thecamonas trahens ATCC 50062 TaxID=461836 RepID=A0A0L0DII3_THETB|nr:hypothetical protein AMSG_00920 [Thecamonas trahens ATCC 50062]KNC52092.1 hypothetical protein AMSG_00920 [Thecamonas trahens ATCC 50062]|eukprot:XP_013762097.1 hypothetical protein AMSG_00920 [Thecamonas trahens ATCC 50062]